MTKNTLEQQVKDLKKAVKEMKASRDYYSQQIEAAQLKINSLEKDLKEAHEECVSLEASCEEYQQAESDQFDECQELTKRVERYEAVFDLLIKAGKNER